MFKNRWLTVSVLIGTLLLLIGFDIWVYVSQPIENTISRVILDTALRHPVLPFVMGVLGGHFFWPQQVKR